MSPEEAARPALRGAPRRVPWFIWKSLGRTARIHDCSQNRPRPLWRTEQTGIVFCHSVSQPATFPFLMKAQTDIDGIFVRSRERGHHRVSCYGLSARTQGDPPRSGTECGHVRHSQFFRSSTAPYLEHPHSARQSGVVSGLQGRENSPVSACHKKICRIELLMVRCFLSGRTYV